MKKKLFSASTAIAFCFTSDTSVMSSESGTALMKISMKISTEDCGINFKLP
jgi:hypothetical protein